MSKMMKALKKAEEAQAQQFAPELTPVLQSSIGPVEDVPVEENNEPVTKNGYGQLMIFLTLIAIGISSIFVSVKTLTELTKSKEVTQTLSTNIDTQHEKIVALKGLLTEVRKENAVQVDQLNTQIKGLASLVKQKEDEMSEMSIDYNVLRVLVNELTITNQNLLDKYIGISREFEKAQISKEELQRQYEDLNQKVERLEAARRTLLSQSLTKHVE